MMHVGRKGTKAVLGTGRLQSSALASRAHAGCFGVSVTRCHDGVNRMVAEKSHPGWQNDSLSLPFFFAMLSRRFLLGLDLGNSLTRRPAGSDARAIVSEF